MKNKNGEREKPPMYWALCEKAPLQETPSMSKKGEGECVFNLKNLENVLAYDILTCHV